MSPSVLRKREEQRPEDTWRLDHLYASDEAWQAAFSATQTALSSLFQWKGTVTKSAQTLLACLSQNDAVAMELDKLYVYANMKSHEDSGNAFYQSMSNQAQLLLVQFLEETAYLTPELSALSPETIARFEAEKGALKVYAHFLENITRKKDHVLSLAEETLLAQAEDMATAPDDIFSMINNADIRFPQVKNEAGELVTLTKGNYTSFMESDNRQVRKDTFEALYDTYLKQKNTIAATYYASVKKDLFFAKARRYDSALAQALDDDNIPVSVYETLIDAVHQYLPLMHRYVALRKKLLGVEELHMYDLYAPLVKEADITVDYETAKETVKKALAPMGKDYQDALQEGFDGGWIDVYENEGKRGGAYSWGTYSGHPYVLLNYAGNINSMFTLAHEMGHALHSYYTWKKQPYIYGGHKIFVAEVASTCNEALLMEYLLQHTENKKAKAYLINYFLEQFKGTFFRQAMFAEFEYKAHAMASQGQPLTCENLSAMYRELNHQYFGDGVVLDDRIDFEWARIPHFYNAYYVYQYATGYTAAIALSKAILEEGEPAVQRYLDFLSKGNSEYSIDLLKGAGVDMTSRKPFDDAMAVFEGLLTKMEALAESL